MSDFDLPLSFLLPLTIHGLAGLTSVVTGVVAFSMPKRRGRHPRWGRIYLWAYTLVFLTATILSFQLWSTHAYLFFIALLGYGFVLGGYVARRFRQHPWVMLFLRKRWMIAHLSGMIGSYIVLWTGFLVDNAPKVPGMNHLPLLTFWLLPTVVGLPFLVRSVLRGSGRIEA